MCCTHKNAVDGARFDTKGTKHTLGIVDREAGDAETLANLYPLFTNIDAVDGTGLGTSPARDTGRQIITMEAAINIFSRS